MTLDDRIQNDLREAMRARDETAKRTLRLLLSAFRNAAIETRAALDDDAALTVVQRQAKQRRESIAEYERAGRSDLVEQEQAELAILERYLPAQIDEADIRAAAASAIASSGATGPGDLGKVMPVLMKELAGRADGRTVNAIVRELLGKS